MRVWCVEDDENINNLVTYALTASGYESKGFLYSKDFIDSIEKEQPDMVILDVMIPEVDGIQLLEMLKSKSSTRDIPVIMLTAKNAEIDKVRALDLGADDYIAKPFGIMELMSRVRAVLRRVTPQEAVSILSLGNISINSDKHLVMVDNIEVQLTLKEYTMLQLLMSNVDLVFTRKQLMDKVWGDSYVGESRTIDMHIKTLRQKLGSAGECIKTIRGVGYKASVDN